MAGAPVLGLLEAVGLALDLDDLGAVTEAIDEGDDAGGAGEDAAPVAEGAVGGDDRGELLVPAVDHLEEQIGRAIIVGEVADLVDDEQLGDSPPTGRTSRSGFAWSSRSWWAAR